MSTQACPNNVEGGGHHFTPGDPPEWEDTTGWDEDAWDEFYSDAVWYCDYCGLSEEDT